MDREQLTHAIAQKIDAEPSLLLLSPYMAAKELLDAILPQVATVEELEALPVGARLIDGADDSLVKVSDRLTFEVEAGTESYVSAEELIADRFEDGDPVWLPLTVVWRPS